MTAWIGPAIGACCYEVGSDVAEAVAAASEPGVVIERPGTRPHLDLQRAIAAQLESAGVSQLRATLERCTHCHQQELWSYRRDGRRAGRNLTFAWRVA